MANENPAENPEVVALKGQILTLVQSLALDDSMKAWIDKSRNGVSEVWEQTEEGDPAPAELTPENREWAERKIDEGYEASQSAIKHHFLREGDRPMPSLEDFKTDVLITLTNAQAKHLLALERAGHVIKFFVTPLASGERFQEVLNKPALKPFKKRIAGQEALVPLDDPVIDLNYKAAIDACRPNREDQSEAVKDYAWTLGVCDNAATARTHADSSIYNILEFHFPRNRIQSFMTYHETNRTGLWAMNPAESAMLQILKLLAGEIQDSYYENVNNLRDNRGKIPKVTEASYTISLQADPSDTSAYMSMIQDGVLCLQPLEGNYCQDKLARLRPRAMHILSTPLEQA